MSLERLAVRAGLDLAYTDAFGRQVLVARETLVAMLRALRYDVNDDADAARELARIDASGARRRFAHTYAIAEGTPLAEAVPQTRSGDYELLDEFGNEVSDLGAFGYYELFGGDGERARIIVAPPHAYLPKELHGGRGWGIGLQLYSLRGARTQGIGDFTTLRDMVVHAQRSGASFVGLNPLHELALDDPRYGSPYSPISRMTLNPMYVDIFAAAEFLGVAFDGEPPLEGALIDYADVARWKRVALERLYTLFSTSPRFAGHEHDDLHSFEQWLAEMQLSQAAVAAQAMPVGLYRDLAVGVGRASDDVRSDPVLYATQLSVGAPPDALNELGQDWDLPPMHPRVLEERGYEPFAALLRANMRHAGALRIDHVMSLQRLYCIPCGTVGGTYLRYDFDAMLAVAKVESMRARCAIVGEDLGTVPDGFRERLHENGILTCSVLAFAAGADGVLPPSGYEPQSIASTGSHDLPPIAGYVHGDDIATRERLGWIDAEQSEAERVSREGSVAALREAFVEAGVSDGMLQDDGAWTDAAYGFLAQTPARLVLVQLEDIFEARESVNVPGTLEEEPNWRRRVPVEVDVIAASERWNSIAAIMRRAGRCTSEVTT